MRDLVGQALENEAAPAFGSHDSVGHACLDAEPEIAG